MFDMMKMMGKAKELQAKVKEAQEALAGLEVSGESGAGLVKVRMNGKKQVIQIEIDDSLLNSADKEVVQDLIVAATNKASEEAEEKARDFMQQQTKDIMPNIPGFDLGSMFNSFNG